jgi:enoyl-CoA hydratase/carnithine racemase
MVPSVCRPDRPVVSDEVLVELVDGVARVTLNRPLAANSRNQPMRAALLSAYSELARSPDVRVLVLTGQGDRFFCAGMDLKEAREPQLPGGARERLGGESDIEALAAFPRPTVAAINGYALGGGLEMALACDIRIMVRDAAIGLTEVRHGLLPGGGGAQRLPRLIGPARALELILMAKVVGGDEAERLGIVNQVVNRADLGVTVDEVVRTISEMPVEALTMAKAAVRRNAEMPMAAAIQADRDVLVALLDARGVG